MRFSLRALIVVVLVIGAGLGWIVRSSQIQREAVAAITNAGGRVYYDWERSNGNHIPAGKPSAPQWLVDLIGVDYFGHVTVVSVHVPAAFGDEAIVNVGRLTRLQVLVVFFTSITDAGLAQLEGLMELGELRLDDTEVTDAGLAHLQGLTSLARLSLADTRVTDAGLAHLRGLNNLVVLELHNTAVTDAGLAHLEGLTSLSSLGLGATHVTDAGLAHLKGLTRLSYLAINGTQVTDGGVQELQNALPNARISR